jgi:thymidylate synthase
MGDWPVLSSNVELGDPKSNIAVVTLSSELKIPKDKVAAFGPLKTENIGIERMVQNVVANPVIRYIVVCGKESPGHESGSALVQLNEKGVDSSNRIVGAGKMAYVHNLTQETINHFRDQVEIIDMIGVDSLDKIVAKIGSLPKKEPYPQKIEPIHTTHLDIAKLKPTHESYLTPNIVYSDTVSDAWYRALRRVWNAGNIVEKDQWGSNTKEIQNLVVMISYPLKEPIHHRLFNWDRKRLEEYSKEYLSPNKGDFEYTYGERLTNWGDASIGEASFIVDQIREVVIPELRKSPKTRRAITVTLNPKIDVRLTSPPCMVTNQFLLREGKLHLTTYFRSHDIFGAALANWFALTRLLEFVSKKTGTKPGTITSVSASAHIYETDFQKTLQILKSTSNEELVARPHPFQPDPEGFFTIGIESDKIVVHYYVPIYQGGPGILNQVVKGKNPKEIYETISRLNVLSRYDHAAYLGSELQKAYTAIKEKKKYVQDGEVE